MTVFRCPRRCNDSKCRVCGGGGYMWGDGSPATPQDMLRENPPTLSRFGKAVYRRRR